MGQLNQVAILKTCTVNLTGILPTGGSPTFAFGTGPGQVPVAYAVDLRDTSAVGLFVKCTGGTVGATFTIEVTNDPLGQTGWATAATRLAGGAAYATTARTVAASSSVSLFLDPTDSPVWVRVNVSANDGTLDGYLTVEQ